MKMKKKKSKHPPTKVRVYSKQEKPAKRNLYVHNRDSSLKIKEKLNYERINGTGKQDTYRDCMTLMKME